MRIASDAFEENSYIPKQYSCEGKNVNPSIAFSDIPDQAKSLVLLVEDPDAPNNKHMFVHWVVFNIPPTTTSISENSVPHEAIEAINDAGSTKYVGPCPPDKPHRYFFRLYALRTTLSLSKTATRDIILQTIEDSIIDSCQLIGLYHGPVQKAAS